MSFIVDMMPWPLAGVAVGVIALGLQWADNLPLGATGAAGGFLDWGRRPTQAPSWRALFFVGIVLGSFLYAAVTGRLSLSWAYPGFDELWGASLVTRGAVLVIAGGLIGFGARWAGGCTSGHGICGVGRLQSGSVLATATFVVTAILVSQIVTRLGALR
jgi:uncharacterized membrane protein YedE/YeeE